MKQNGREHSPQVGLSGHPRSASINGSMLAAACDVFFRKHRMKSCNYKEMLFGRRWIPAAIRERNSQRRQSIGAQ